MIRGMPTMPKRIKISISYSSFFERIIMPSTKNIIALTPPNAKVRKGSIPPLRIEPNIKPPNDNFPTSISIFPMVVLALCQFLFAISIFYIVVTLLSRKKWGVSPIFYILLQINLLYCKYFRCQNVYSLNYEPFLRSCSCNASSNYNSCFEEFANGNKSIIVNVA